MMLDEPDIVETHFVRKNALLNGFFDHGMVVQGRPLHFISQAEFHGVAPDESEFCRLVSEGEKPVT